MSSRPLTAFSKAYLFAPSDATLSLTSPRNILIILRGRWTAWVPHGIEHLVSWINDDYIILIALKIYL